MNEDDTFDPASSMKIGVTSGQSILHHNDGKPVMNSDKSNPGINSQTVDAAATFAEMPLNQPSGL